MANTCAELAVEIAALRAEIARIPQVDEARIVQTTRSALQPDITTAIAAGGAVIVNKLEPQIKEAAKSASNAFLEIVENTRKQRLQEIEIRGAQSTATRAEANAAEYARRMRLQEAELTKINGDNARLNRQNKAIELSTAELRELNTKNTRGAERLAQQERKNAGRVEAIEKEIPPIRNTANNAKGIADSAAASVEQVRVTANNAARTAGTAISEAATATKNALNSATEVTGLRGVVNGIGSKINDLGRAIAKVEASVGEAITKAARAIGISSEALSATARLGGRIIEIFNIIGTFAVLFEQVATLNVLGGRIDAVESGTLALGRDVSGVLGYLLQLKNRIANDEGTINNVREIAVNATGIAQSASLRADGAYSAAGLSQQTANVAIGKANQAQLTADGAVRNAAQANENAMTAYQKAVESEKVGSRAEVKADISIKKATDADTKATASQKTATEAKGAASAAGDFAGKAFSKAGEAIGLGLTAIALYQTVRFLRGLPGRNGRDGINGRNGTNGLSGITTIVQIPGQPGAPGRPGVGIPGRNGINGVNVNPADIASLRALIITQHAATRTNINATSTGLVSGVKLFFTTQLAGITGLITAIATNTYVEKALAVLTFAATMHNAFMLSNNLVQTLGAIIDQVLGLIVPKGLDGAPISIGNVLGKVAHEIVADTIGEANYKEMTEDWAKANRIYQAGANVFNQIGNAVSTITTGLEMVGGNIGKIGNALKFWGVLSEKAYSWMNPQPNFHGRFFNYINSAQEGANSIAAMVAIPVAISAAAIEVNNNIGIIQKELDQEDPKDIHGNPQRDKNGNIIRYQPGVTVPEPTKTVLAAEQAKADSKNIFLATIDDLFDGSD